MLYRTYLFAPGNSTKILTKAMRSSADAVIIDLEDAVAYAEKEKVRNQVKLYLQQSKDIKPTYIRINDRNTPFWEDDLAVAVFAGIQGIVLPKAENKKEVKEVCDNVNQLLKQDGRGTMSFEVIPLIETAKGVENVLDVAASHPYVIRMAFGSIDYSVDIGCELTESGMETLYARSKIVNASRAVGIESPIDAVYPDLENDEGLFNETVRAKKLGFKGKLIIHPKQIEKVNSLFTITPAEAEEANLIVYAFEEAEKRGLAAITVGGKFVDYPVYRRARKIVTDYPNHEQGVNR